MDPFLNELLGNSNDEFPASTKTEEEIKKLTLEENMPETKRTIHILSRGQQIQKISVYMNLHKILLEPDAFNKVLPLVAEDILNQTEENQVECAKSLRKVVCNKSVSQTSLLQVFQMTCSILKVWNQAVLDEWALVFNEIVKVLPYELIARDCEITIMSLSEPSQHTLSKYVAVRLVGFIAGCGLKNTTQLFDRARILCQDPDYEIRKILADEVMLKICFNAGTDLTESKYLEKIMELLYDSNISIKLSAIDAIVNVTDILSYEYKKTRMIAVFLELMNSINEDVMKKMSFHVGLICHKLEDVLPRNSNQFVQIQNIFRDWSTSKNSEIKKNVIYNLPYMIKTFDNKEHFKSLYLKIMRDVSSSNKNLRLMTISSFPEICKAYKNEELPPIFKETFESLLKETETEVVKRLADNLLDLIQIFQTKRDDEEDPEGREEAKKEEKYRDPKQPRSNPEIPEMSYLADILKLGEQLKINCLWRSEIVFMDSLNKAYDYFDIKEMGDKYVNYLFEKMAEGCKDVRSAAISSLMIFLKRNYYTKRTSEIVKTIVQNLSSGPSYNHRLLFLEIYEKLAENFSKRFLKQYNLNELVMKLGDDKVPLVRKKVFEIAILLKRMLSPSETAIGIKVEDALKRNKADEKNKLVSETAKNVHKELNSLTQYYFQEFDDEDKKRMAEEDALKEKEQKFAEDPRKKASDDLNRDRSDYLYTFSSIMGTNGARKGAKKPTFKGDVNIANKNVKSPTIPYPTTSSTVSKPKTLVNSNAPTLGAKLTSSASDPINKRPSVNFHGTVPISSITGKKPEMMGQTTIGFKSSTPSDNASKPTSSGKLRTTNEAPVKSEQPKYTTSIKSPPSNDNLDKPAKDYVKVPTIKRKI